MRAYVTIDVPGTKAIWRDGFTDLYEVFDEQSGASKSGVYVATRPLDANDGFMGDVTLCLEVPEGLFNRYYVPDAVNLKSGYRMALVPAEELNRLGKSQVYDHTYTELSRRDLVQYADKLEAAGPQYNDRVQEMREAIRFFDDIGWLKPLKLQEAAVNP
jgi:hypothetical protein